MNRGSINLLSLYLCIILLSIQLPLYAAKDKKPTKITPSELQSQLMSFADRFMGKVSGSTIEYTLNNPTITARQRALVMGRKLEASSAAVRIAAGSNPEVGLLDMVALVSLLKHSTDVDMLPNLRGTDGKPMLDAYRSLEKEIWLIANPVLSKEQQKELHELITQRKNDGQIRIGLAYFPLSDLIENRRNSTLVDKGDPGWFLANISEAKKELEHARVLAERALYSAERQATLIRWQVEQVFYDLAIEPETVSLLNSTEVISQATQRLATALETMPTSLSTESTVFVKVLMREIQTEREEMINQMFKEIAKERQETIDQASNQFMNKGFYFGAILILLLIFGGLAAALVYQYIMQRRSARQLHHSE